MTPRALTSLLITLTLTACGGADDSAPSTADTATADTGTTADTATADTGTTADTATEDTTDPPTRLSIALERVAGTGDARDPFVVVVTREQGPDDPEAPTLELERGSASAPEIDGAVARFTVTPEGSGEHPVTARWGGEDASMTALVLSGVADGWGQPEMVGGLANTVGYEDGVTITPDGQWLFVQTGPWRFSGLLAFNAPRAQGGCGGQRLTPTPCEHPWVNTTHGPYTAPARPDFFDGRIEDGRFRHNSNLYQVPDEGAPNWPPPTMFYGFRRQPDGTFADPFYIAFEDANDAIMNPFGLSFQLTGPSTARILFALNDPTRAPQVELDVTDDGVPDITVPSGFDVYTTTVTLGEHNTLGVFAPGDAPQVIERVDFPPQPLQFGAVGPDGVYGTQGNPHLDVGPDGMVRAVWTDDEYDTDPSLPSHDDLHDLSVYVLDGDFPEGPWTKVVLPDVINTEAEQIQPYFAGTGLLYTQDTEVFFAAYDGPHTAAGYADPTSWGAPTRILGKDALASLTDAPLGSVVAIGEPTSALVDGVVELYFVYATVRGFDPLTGLPDLDFNAGRVALQ